MSSDKSEEFAKQVGLRIPEEAALSSEGLRQYRSDYVAAMRVQRWRGREAHAVVDAAIPHAWEMEDKDLSAEDGA